MLKEFIYPNKQKEEGKNTMFKCVTLFDKQTR